MQENRGWDMMMRIQNSAMIPEEIKVYYNKAE